MNPRLSLFGTERFTSVGVEHGYKRAKNYLNPPTAQSWNSKGGDAPLNPGLSLFGTGLVRKYGGRL